MAVVKLVESMWTFEKRKKHSDELAEAGRKLYEKLVGYTDSFLEVGASLKKAQDTYERALGQLRDGRGSATKLAHSMLLLGVTPTGSKRLPAQVLDSDGDDQGNSAN
jgi:DNA recombination protein RmuC